MNIIKIAKFLLLVFCVCCVLAEAADQQGEEVRRQTQTTASAASYPGLRVEFEPNAKVKIFVPNRSYRRGDLLKLDVGLLLTNTTKYYFPAEFRYRLPVKDSRGRAVRIKPNIHVDNKLFFEKHSNTLLTQSTYLIIGCDVPELTNFRKSFEIADLDSPESLLDKNLFGVPADGCIDIRGRGTLDVSVEAYNELVVIPEPPAYTKTLVGSVQSPSLRIQIED